MSPCSRKGGVAGKRCGGGGRSGWGAGRKGACRRGEQHGSHSSRPHVQLQNQNEDSVIEK